MPPLLLRLPATLRRALSPPRCSRSPGAAPAHAWWDSTWTQRRAITIDPAAAGVTLTGPLGATPVLIRLHDANFHFTDAKQDGGDLRFVAADDKTPLAFHFEKFDPLLDEALVWVNVPAVASGAGNEHLALLWQQRRQGGQDRRSQGHHDADTVLVYHFSNVSPPAPAIDAIRRQRRPRRRGGHGEHPHRHGLTLTPQHGEPPRLPRFGLGRRRRDGLDAWVTRRPAGAAVHLQPSDGADALVDGDDNDSAFCGGCRRQRRPPRAAAGPPCRRHLASFAVTAGGGSSSFMSTADYASLDAALPALNTSASIGRRRRPGRPLDDCTWPRSPSCRPRLAAVTQGGNDAAEKLVSPLGRSRKSRPGLAQLPKDGYFGIIISSLTVDGLVIDFILMGMAANQLVP